MTGSFNPVHRFHIEIMMATKAHLSRMGHYVVGGFMSMNCGDDHESDLKYSLLARACSLAGGEKGWLQPTSGNIDPLTCNGAAQHLYNYL